ncbi:nucleoside-diphosphate sugar epimerase/dehydratase [Carnobacterium viridans]|uniref:NDP-sugar epimerase, includes UDP-GlcNAc-inverting 4,6-dehydratase FlaA1 and capsular polysaccharide biosynthesis protein EpsC n=1 Tax=Carnobacterium viridans TaxID=174587 RepID=A0A1H0YGN0_9LACT|nr:nucleoside-diphosphate sugar epimerase/dehydratase [Carnobacterium viridans]SDQ14190.1 NDP-sugar epimerase, includes UDP-GlcNAc-inverting 4,6-dehydratase FlaA1 and capsular polysaccharide biosynthesis protein EpsC [Carnobacterium viridans]
MSRKTKKGILIGFDSFSILASGWIAYFFLNPYIALSIQSFITTIVLTIILYLVLAIYFKLFSKINRYTSIQESLAIAIYVTYAFIASALISVVLLKTVSFRFIVLTYIFSLASIAGSRIVWRIYNEHQYKKRNGHSAEQQIKTLIVGAGNGGSIFIRSLKRNPSDVTIVGIVDDDPAKLKTWMYGIPVIGNINDIPELAKKHKIQQITITIPSLEPKEYERMLDICNQAEITVNQMPSIEDVLQGKLSVSQFREIDVVDLLGREEVKLDMQQIATKLSDKTILVSGAGGSIGSEICRQIAQFSPKCIIVLGHGENSIYQINKELNRKYKDQIEIIPVIADVQDRKRLFEVMKKYIPDRVYHAAAHKHVPMMEYNPREAVKNNILGTKNIAEAAKEAGVGSFVMISTDKAVNPPNVMGATKRVAEMIITSLNEKGKTKFAAVRFGNVLGSRGSVIPLFKEQIKNGGPVTVTDFRMTRYFMTIPEASRLVIQAGALAQGGEIFILDMGEPVKIVDLAKKVIKLSGYTENEIPIIETGIRPGEKLYEELLVDSEQTDQQVYEKIFVGKVTEISLAQVMAFVYTLDECTSKELKERLLEFTNEKSEKEVDYPIQNEKKGAHVDVPKTVQTSY